MLKSQMGSKKAGSPPVRFCWWELSSAKYADSSDAWVRCENGNVLAEQDLEAGAVASLSRVLRGERVAGARWRRVRDALIGSFDRALSPYFGSMCSIPGAGVGCAKCKYACKPVRSAVAAQA